MRVGRNSKREALRSPAGPQGDMSLSRARNRRRVCDPDASALCAGGAGLRAAPSTPRAATKGIDGH
eukprot:15470110-Alexandrium_andersonii.AAC.1